MTIEETIKQTLQEDIGDGDHSSLSCVSPSIMGKMQLLSKDSGVIAGIEIAEMILKEVNPAIMMEKYKKDGDEIRYGEVVFMISGPAQSMLTAERTLLNFVQRMSGIATNTRQYVDELKGTGATILDTRKTTPNMRVFEKYAVLVGGAENHRFGLYDMIMLKDNHIDFAGGIEAAIDKTQNYLREKHLNLKIEIETRNIDEVTRVIRHGGVDRIMLDNFTPEKIVDALKVIDKQYETEASGGITLSNIREYAQTGVDYISVGSLTHQIKSLDLSLKFVDENYCA